MRTVPSVVSLLAGLALVAWSAVRAQECAMSEGAVVECRARLPTREELLLLEREPKYVALRLHEFNASDPDSPCDCPFYRRLEQLEISQGSDLEKLDFGRFPGLRSVNLSRSSWTTDIFVGRTGLCDSLPALRVLDVGYNEPLQRSPTSADKRLPRFDRLIGPNRSPCAKLAWLSLAGNALGSFTPDDDHRIDNPTYKSVNDALEYLDLSENKLARTSHVFDLFNWSPNLRQLNLSTNRLKAVGPVFFKTLGKLVELDLSKNQIDVISDGAFDELPLLETLVLSDNELFTFEGVFDGPANYRYLKRLNLAGNRLKLLKPDWFKELAKLEELDISRNKLTSIHADTLQHLASLSVLKVAKNPLIERDLSFLLGTGRNLHTVDASRIGLVRVPATLTRSVRTLKLVGNHLTYITSGDLDSYPLLESLDLSDNSIQIIEEDALGRLDGLQELILVRNILPAIPKSLSLQLKVLNLRQNAISKLKAKDLQGLCSLKILNLSGNVIDSIEGEFFRQLTGLESLDISENPIKKLPSDALSGPASLRILRMSDLWLLETEANQNHDTAFPILALERLVTLDLSRSPVLAAQLLADNAALSACKSLEELDLSYTGITSIRSDLAYVLPRLRKLNLIGNMWNCTPDQFWLGAWARELKASSLLSTRCKAPTELEGKLLEEIASPHPTPGVSATFQITDGTDKSNNWRDQEWWKKLIESRVTQDSSTAATPTTVTNAPKGSTTNDTPLFTRNFNTTNKSLPVGSTAATTFFSTPLTKKIEFSNKTTTELNQLQKIKIDSEKAIGPANEKSIKTTRSTTESLVKLIDNLKETTSTKAGELLAHSAGESEVENPIVVTNEEVWSTLCPTSESKEHTSKTLNYEATRNQKPVTNPSNESTPSTPGRDNTSTTEKTEKAESTEHTMPSSAVSTGQKIINSFTNQKTLVQQKQSAIDKYPEKESFLVKKKDVEKKSGSRVLTELSRSKLLLANEEQARANDETRIIVAEELNGRATNSPSFAGAGAHPGMLILLGAAIGAAAALTVVLSRRATVTRRDRQYQRHENIEVHALTPTTELW